jgi:hypothetical protein
LLMSAGGGVKGWIGRKRDLGKHYEEKIVHNSRAMITRESRKGFESGLKRKSIVSVQSR